MQRLSPIGWALRPLKNYARFSGRASRAEFWWFFLFVMVIYIAALFIIGGLGAGVESMNPGTALMSGAFSGFVIVVVLFWLLLFVPMLAVQMRRLHDINRSGWWLGAFWLIYVIYMGLIFSMRPSAGATPGSVNMGGLAMVGIVALLMFIYSIVLLVFFCLRGTAGPNDYGPDPYGEQDLGEVFG